MDKFIFYGNFVVGCHDLFNMSEGIIQIMLLIIYLT